MIGYDPPPNAAPYPNDPHGGDATGMCTLQSSTVASSKVETVKGPNINISKPDHHKDVVFHVRNESNSWKRSLIAEKY